MRSLTLLSLKAVAVITGFAVLRVTPSLPLTSEPGVQAFTALSKEETERRLCEKAEAAIPLEVRLTTRTELLLALLGASLSGGGGQESLKKQNKTKKGS